MHETLIDLLRQQYGKFSSFIWFVEKSGFSIFDYHIVLLPNKGLYLKSVSLKSPAPSFDYYKKLHDILNQIRIESLKIIDSNIGEIQCAWIIQTVWKNYRHIHKISIELDPEVYPPKIALEI